MVLDGFTITGGNDVDSCGISCRYPDADVVVRHNTIHVSPYGMQITEAGTHQITVEDNWFWRCCDPILDAQGKAISCSGASAFVSISNNTIVGRASYASASNAGIELSSCTPSGSPRIANNIIAFNDTSILASSGNTSTPTITHNRYCGNNHDSSAGTGNTTLTATELAWLTSTGVTCISSQTPAASMQGTPAPSHPPRLTSTANPESRLQTWTSARTRAMAVVTTRPRLRTVATYGEVPGSVTVTAHVARWDNSAAVGASP